ncbi:hypothetical protein [Streptomyces sp. NRRL S-350]|uniref:hypothetical protein n=1 Tax=Streptomyces sp. NRRL S-350 TaxID=1463902 RepID=UPI0004C27F64|nr:hypothetical protein [Streptomyces sp. NRRL S-350]
MSDQHLHTFPLRLTTSAQDTDPADQQIAELLGAAYEGCTSCQDGQLTLITTSASATARLVLLALELTVQRLGLVPSELTVDAVPGRAALPFRRLARTSPDPAQMLRTCEGLLPGPRRAAANTAIDIAVGFAAASPGR